MIGRRSLNIKNWKNKKHAEWYKKNRSKYLKHMQVYASKNPDVSKRLQKYNKRKALCFDYIFLPYFEDMRYDRELVTMEVINHYAKKERMEIY